LRNNRQNHKGHEFDAPPSLWTYDALHMRVRPHLLQGAARVEVDAGSGSVDDGDGDLGLKLVHPLQHRPHSPAVVNGHIIKGRLPTGTTEEEEETLRHDE